MSPSQEAMETAESASQFQGRDSSASDAGRSSRHYQFETDQFRGGGAAAISRRIRKFTRERCDRISNQRCFLVASGPAHESRTKFGALGVRWAQ